MLKIMEKVVLILVGLLSILDVSFAIECYRLTQNSQDYIPISNQRFQCPAYVGQCFKFVCMGANPYIAKGCVDYNDPQSNAETLRAQCAGRPGYGSYYTCGRNRCNSSVGFQLSAAALLMPLLTYIYSKLS